MNILAFLIAIPVFLLMAVLLFVGIVLSIYFIYQMYEIFTDKDVEDFG